MMQQSAQAPGTQTLTDANTFTFSGPIRISYSSTSISGQPLFSYKDADLDLNFFGDEITRVGTAIGELVTVTIENAVDAFVRTFTVVVPSIRLGRGETVEFETYGFETTDRSFAFVVSPGPRGVLQHYDVHALHGTAEQVIS